MKDKTIRDTLEQLIGLSTWGSKKGYGSFLTFNLGTPRVEFDEPRIQKVFGESEIRFPKDTYKTRRVHIKGEHFIWIYCYNWEISIEEKVIAHNESEDNHIKNSVDYIDGQILTKIIINSKDLTMKLVFDLGGIITIMNSDFYKLDTELMGVFQKFGAGSFPPLGTKGPSEGKAKF